MESVVNVATPFTADTVLVPESVPLPAFVLNDIVTGAVADESMFPYESVIATRGAGLIAAPAAALVGSVTNFRRFPVLCTVVNALLVADVSAPLVAFKV